MSDIIPALILLGLTWLFGFAIGYARGRITGELMGYGQGRIDMYNDSVKKEEK